MAGRIQRFLRRAGWVADRIRKRGGVVPPRLWKRLERRYDQWVQEALDYHLGLSPLPTGRRGCGGGGLRGAGTGPPSRNSCFCGADLRLGPVAISLVFSTVLEGPVLQ